MSNITHPKDAEYIGILEAVVAVLAVKLGMHPEKMMANAIIDISNQLGMETIDTDRLIHSRWDHRNIRQIQHVALRIAGPQNQMSDVRSQRNLPQVVSSVVPEVPISDRLAEYHTRRDHPDVRELAAAEQQNRLEMRSTPTVLEETSE